MTDAKINMLPIELIPLSSINPASNNTKIHTQEQIDSIKKSILEFGFNDPIAIDDKMEIIEGHGRFAAVTQLGGEVIPCIRLDELSEDQVRAYRIAHNKITMQTGFDMGMLKSELTDLDLSGFDIDVTGFTMEEFSFEDSDLSFPDMEDNDDDEDMEVQKPKKATSSVVQYILIFDDEGQQKEWYKLLKHLRHEGVGDTIAEKLINFLKDNNPEIF
jgi:hypothetical protein